MSWTDPARVEKLESLLYQCLSTFACMLEYPAKCADDEHMRHARDKLEEKMNELDLPDYQTWKRSAGKGHLDWTCHMALREDLRGHAFQDTYECDRCGEQVIRETYMGESEPPRFCPNCGRKAVSE